MKVDIDGEQLIVDPEDTELRNDQKLQLGFWFKRMNGQFISSNLTVLNKTLDYLDSEGIKYNLGEDANSHILGRATAAKAHRGLLNDAMGFKEGKFDKSKFDAFSGSLSGLVKRQLKDHQIKSTYHLSLICNGANFSVPGSGKTTVVLTYFQMLRAEGNVNTLFVVGPPACFFPWQDEYKEVIGKKPRSKIMSGMNKDTRLFTYSDTQKPQDLYLITFQTLLNDSEDIKKFLNDKNIKALLVIDEAHYMKRVDGNWANAVLNIAEAAVYRCALTGTPMPKSYSDLLNLMKFLWPDENPITNSDRAKLEIYEEKSDFESASKLLEPKIGPLFYRVRKRDLGLKPQIFKDPTYVRMNDNERIFYDAIVNKIRDYDQDDYLRNIELVSKLRRGRMIRVRQSLAYSKLLLTALEDYHEDLLEGESDLKKLLIDYDEIERPAKLDALLNMTRKLLDEGKKVLIWSNFIGSIELMMKNFKEEGIYCKKITGSVPVEREKVSVEETREKIRDEFVDPDSGLNVLIANPAACAESISLHKTCHHAIYYDLSYNLAQYLQSLDRIHRVGASEVYSAYYDYLVYEDTVDIDILETLKKKAERMYQLIDKDYRIYSLDMSEMGGDEEAYARLFEEK